MNLGVILQGLKTGVRLEFIEALHDWLTQKIFLFNEHTIPFVEVDTRIVCTHNCRKMACGTPKLWSYQTHNLDTQDRAGMSDPPNFSEIAD